MEIRTGNLFKYIVFGVLLCFLSLLFKTSVFDLKESLATELGLPEPTTLLSLTDDYTPLVLRGIQLDLNNPLSFDLVLDEGDQKLSEKEFHEESSRLIKYFLAAVTTPEEDLWVNLSPYENNRIIPESLSKTDLGRDMLAQDYILKQLSSSLTFPETELGMNYWKSLETEQADQLNKIWIVPQAAKIYVDGPRAIIGDSSLKIQTEMGSESQEIIETLNKEVNHGSHFAKLRQIYNALILATWFKQTVRESLYQQLYVDKNMIQGANHNDSSIKDKLFSLYCKAFDMGVYKLIKKDPLTKEKRQYFSGGFSAEGISTSSSIHPMNGLDKVYGSKAMRVTLNPQLRVSSSSSALTANEFYEKSIDNFSDYSDRIIARKQNHVKRVNEIMFSFINKNFSNFSELVSVAAEDLNEYIASLEKLYLIYDALSEQEKKILILATIFHDIGDDGSVRSAEHAENGRKVSLDIFEDLAYEPEIVQEAAKLVGLHGFWGDVGVARLPKEFSQFESKKQAQSLLLLDLFDALGNPSGRLNKAHYIDLYMNYLDDEKKMDYEKFALNRIARGFLPICFLEKNLENGAVVLDELVIKNNLDVDEQFIKIWSERVKIKSFDFFARLLIRSEDKYLNFINVITSEAQKYDKDILIDTKGEFLGLKPEEKEQKMLLINNMEKIPFDMIELEDRIEIRISFETEEESSSALETIIWDFDNTIFTGAHAAARVEQGRIIAEILAQTDESYEDSWEEGKIFFDDTQGMSDQERFQLAIDKAISQGKHFEYDAKYYSDEFLKWQLTFVDDVIADWKENLDDYLIPGVLDMLEAAKAKGIKQSIVTGSSYLSKELVDDLGLGHYFDLVYGAGSWPYQETYSKQKAMEKIAASSEGDLYVVGDGIAELKAGRNINDQFLSEGQKRRIYSVGIENTSNQSAMEAFKPDMTLNNSFQGSVAEILDIALKNEMIDHVKVPIGIKIPLARSRRDRIDSLGEKISKLKAERKINVTFVAGRTGSGKSTVVKYLEQQGHEVLYVDSLANKYFADMPSSVSQQMRDEFGTDFYNTDGSYDKQAMRLATGDVLWLFTRLSQYISEDIVEYIAESCQKYQDKTIFIEAAHFRELYLPQSIYDNVIFVEKNEKERINDFYTRSIAKGQSEEYYSSHYRALERVTDLRVPQDGDIVVENNGTLDELYSHLDSILETLSSSSNVGGIDLSSSNLNLDINSSSALVLNFDGISIDKDDFRGFSFEIDSIRDISGQNDVFK